MRIILKTAVAAVGAMLVSNMLLAGTSNPPPPQPITCAGGNAVTGFSYGTLPTCGAPIAGGTINTGTAGQLTDYTAATAVSPITTGTGVVTALGVNTGSAGAFVVNGGALGTPSAGTLTNATGLPISTGVSGLGTGIATALAVNAGSAGAPVINGGVLGTPSSGTLTNLTGLPLTTGVTGILPAANGGTGLSSLGTGVATFLGTPSSANLLAALTTKTGTGLSVFGTAPTVSALTLSDVATGTQCLHANSAGLISGTGSDCGAGGGGLTVGTSTITSGTTGRLFYDNAGVLGEAVVGSGLSLSAGTLTATGGGATTGYGVDGGTTASSVTGTGTIPNAARLVKVAAGWATGTLTLPAISAVSADTCIRIEDGGNFIDGTHTLTLKGGVSDGLNGGAANGTVGPFTTAGSFLVACVSATNNWNVGPGTIAASTGGTSPQTFVHQITVNGAVYTQPALADVSGVNATVATALAGAPQGNGAKVQLSTGAGTSGKCVEFDANGNTVVAVSNAACGSGGGGGITCPAGFSQATNTADCVWTFSATSGSPSAGFVWHDLTLRDYDISCDGLGSSNATARFSIEFSTGSGATPTFTVTGYVFQGSTVFDGSAPTGAGSGANTATGILSVANGGTAFADSYIEGNFHGLTATSGQKSATFTSGYHIGTDYYLFHTNGWDTTNTGAAIQAIRFRDNGGGNVFGTCTLRTRGS